MKPKDFQQTNRRGRVLRYAPVLLWIGLIFYFSTMQGSMSNTSRFIRPMLVFLFPQAPEETLLLYHSYIRKAAHFIEYAGLAFWAARAFWSSAAGFLRSNWYLWAFGLVLLTAAADELNQSFNTARTASVYDVLLDCGGGLTMILILYLYEDYRQKRVQ